MEPLEPLEPMEIQSIQLDEFNSMVNRCADIYSYVGHHRLFTRSRQGQPVAMATAQINI